MCCQSCDPADERGTATGCCNQRSADCQSLPVCVTPVAEQQSACLVPVCVCRCVAAVCLSVLQVALRDLQPLIDPSLTSLKHRLEERVRLSRGPTPLERLDFLTSMAR